MNESIDNDKRSYEFINGKIYMMARPSLNHITISAKIWKIFDTSLAKKICKSYIEPDVHLDDDNTVIPDVIIVCDKNKRKGKSIYGPPDLAVEVLSPSTAKRDFDDKRDLYENFGVKEYWIVSPEERTVQVFHLKDGKLKLDRVYYYKTEEEKEFLPEDDLKSLVSAFKVSFYDDLVIHLAEIFEDME
ncbi:MAG: Uma2 family endonuclease [Clostridiales bacterium]|nr:Uma2 family endonuclease [Clostridiales bacterium]